VIPVEKGPSEAGGDNPCLEPPRQEPVQPNSREIHAAICAHASSNFPRGPQNIGSMASEAVRISSLGDREQG